jgi:hypothetical protein
MSLWNSESNYLTPITLVANNEADEFKLRVEFNEIIIADQKVYIVSDNCLGDNDIKFISKTIEEITSFEFCQDDFWKELYRLCSIYEFSQCNILLNKFPSDSILLKRIFEYLTETFTIYDSLLNCILVDSPLSEDGIWLESQLEISNYINKYNSFPYLDYCPLNQEVKKKVLLLKEIGEQYGIVKPYKKLAIISSLFLFYSKVYSSREDYSKSILFLHRALETCFKSWLLSENQLALDKKGEVHKDGFTYLLGYKKKVLKFRSLTDPQKLAIEDLNTERNNSKFAHGYTSTKKETLSSILQEIELLLFEDEYLKLNYKQVARSFKVPESFCEVLFKFLKTEDYIGELSTHQSSTS